MLANTHGPFSYLVNCAGIWPFLQMPADNQVKPTSDTS